MLGQDRFIKDYKSPAGLEPRRQDNTGLELAAKAKKMCFFQ